MNTAAPTLARRFQPTTAPLLAAALALATIASGRHGPDIAAQLYRIALFRANGLTLWDSQWYGGHWALNYSVLFPPIAALTGATIAAVASATFATWSFDRLVVAHFGRHARLGSALFGLATVSQVAIGQLTYLMGEALGLAAFRAAAQRRFGLAAVLAGATALTSPLAAVFLGMALIAAALHERARRDGALRLTGVAAAAGLPVLVTSALFPGPGDMPFVGLDFATLVVVVLFVDVFVLRGQPALRIGARLYLAAVVFCFVVPSPVGGNVERLGESLGAPLVACALWPARRRVLALTIAPIAALQLGGPIQLLLSAGGAPASKQSYFQPLVGFLLGHDDPAGRVEVVGTSLHSEAAYVAPVVPLARGWERQLDIADNPLFYGKAPLTQATYRAWLVSNGVRFVALPDGALDYAAVAEAALVRRGVAGLRLVWSNPHWRVFEVADSSGIVAGPARLLDLRGDSIALDAIGPGPIDVRVHYEPGWVVSAGGGCVTESPTSGLLVSRHGTGDLVLTIGLDTDTPQGC